VDGRPGGTSAVMRMSSNSKTIYLKKPSDLTQSMLHPQERLSHLVQVIRAMVQLQERFMMFYASNRMAVPPGNIPIQGIAFMPG
jgi:hypothetical protein